jgi:hypothetical protein
MAEVAGSGEWGTRGVGRRSVPSSPDSPWMAGASGEGVSMSYKAEV